MIEHLYRPSDDIILMFLPLLFGDQTRVAILELLIRERDGLSQRAIAARIGRSPSHVNNVIQAFAGLGILDQRHGRRVRLNEDASLFGPIMETLDRFAELQGQGRLLRTVIRAANDRFGQRYFVGGYLAATKAIQPIDFHSDRCDLYVKGLRRADETWKRPLDRLSPFQIHLHPAEMTAGHARNTDTIDDEPCWVATPEVGVVQCLQDPTFPRYGAFLLLIQALDEWSDERLMGLVLATEGGVWESRLGPLRELMDGDRTRLPGSLEDQEQEVMMEAIATVRGHG